MSKIMAGIVVYNPDIQRLRLNISRIAAQVDIVAIQNNGGIDESELLQIKIDFDNVRIIGDGNNVGIAAALNRLAEYADTQGAEWLLTLDQDSVCEKKLISEYEKYIFEKDVGLITCTITDRNFEYNADPQFFDVRYIEKCITSGSCIRIQCWKAVGGFDEKMFIDSVDTDYCYRLRIAGWKILQTSYKGLLHEVGTNTTRKQLLGKEFVVFNHSAFRCYYIVRNQIYFARKHKKTLGIKKSLRMQRTAWTRIFVYLLYEKNKRKKMKAWAKGLIDGYKMDISTIN